MRTCEEVRSQLSALLDGELPEAERRDVEAHLAGCPDCRACLADLTAMGDALRSLDAKAPEGFARRVMDRVRETEQEKPARRVVGLRWRRWAAAAACFAVAAALLVWRGGAESGDSGVVMMSRSAGTDVAVYSAETGGGMPDEPDGRALERGFALPADSAPEDAAEAVTLTTGSETAAAWVEEHLGLAWSAGTAYALTAEQYADLRQALADAGADFAEAGEGETYLLIAR